MDAKTRPGAESHALDFVIASDRWSEEPDSERVIARAIKAAAAAIGLERGLDLCLMLADDEEMRILNNRWRGQNKPTNVLSFPAPPAPAQGASRLGDIAIGFETVAREAREQGKPFADHLSHLAVHGFLHLSGYDHQSEAEAQRMEALERDILAQLAVPDPYAPREP